MTANPSPTAPMFESHVPGLERVHQGKVRDIYAVDDDRLLIVTSDRLSAFDVVLPDPIPGKGRVLTSISRFWFERTRHIVANHLTDEPLASVVADDAVRSEIADRSMIVRRLEALPIEAVVRGYLIGSGWRDYQRDGTLCGIRLPDGLEQAERLPEPLFTPATKAAPGEHDENIGYDAVVDLLGPELADSVRRTALELYRYAAAHALERGIIIADTKFEFGRDVDGSLVLIDEALTPDSSRFWPVDSYRPGTSPPSFDKQYVRDYLETLDWDKRAPGPRLPAEVIAGTSERYAEALRRLTS
jgi:phosphoribosylaminoimidazole-succinocarboxamide synthase